MSETLTITASVNHIIPVLPGKVMFEFMENGKLYATICIKFDRNDKELIYTLRRTRVYKNKWLNKINLWFFKRRYSKFLKK